MYYVYNLSIFFLSLVLFFSVFVLHDVYLGLNLVIILSTRPFDIFMSKIIILSYIKCDKLLLLLDNPDYPSLKQYMIDKFIFRKDMLLVDKGGNLKKCSCVNEGNISPIADIIKSKSLYIVDFLPVYWDLGIYKPDWDLYCEFETQMQNIRRQVPDLPGLNLEDFNKYLFNNGIDRDFTPLQWNALLSLSELWKVFHPPNQPSTMRMGMYMTLFNLSPEEYNDWLEKFQISQNEGSLPKFLPKVFSYFENQQHFLTGVEDSDNIIRGRIYVSIGRDGEKFPFYFSSNLYPRTYVWYKKLLGEFCLLPFGNRGEDYPRQVRLGLGFPSPRIVGIN